MLSSALTLLSATDKLLVFCLFARRPANLSSNAFAVRTNHGSRVSSQISHFGASGIKGFPNEFAIRTYISELTIRNTVQLISAGPGYEIQLTEI